MSRSKRASNNRRNDTGGHRPGVLRQDVIPDLPPVDYYDRPRALNPRSKPTLPSVRWKDREDPEKGGAGRG